MLIESVENKLIDWKKSNLNRRRMRITGTEGNIAWIDSSQCINFSQNDYLGLSKHPQIIEATIKGVERYGLGSGSSSVVSGYYDAQQRLEAEFAEWLNLDSAILLSSGYLANIGIIPALIDRNNTIFSDKLSHASILDGIQLSRAKHYRYKHHSMIDLERLAAIKKPDLIISESVFSMEGTIASVENIMQIAERYQASVLLDDAHGIGVLGKNGRGICEHAKIETKQLACVIIPLGKAFNAMGAIAAGKKEVIEAILQFARSYRFSTALPPAIAEALLTTLNLIKTEGWRREGLNEVITIFIENALARGLTLSSTDPTPIKSIMIGDNQKVLDLQQLLLSKGFFVAGIRPPTVPKDSARIRISLNCHHTEEQIIRLLDLVCEGLKVDEKQN